MRNATIELYTTDTMRLHAIFQLVRTMETDKDRTYRYTVSRSISKLLPFVIIGLTVREYNSYQIFLDINHIKGYSKGENRSRKKKLLEIIEKL